MDSETRAEIEALKAEHLRLVSELTELKLSRRQRLIRAVRRNKRVALVLALIAILIPATAYALSITKTFTFNAGNPTVAAEVNANFDQLFTKVNDLAAYHPPIGTILAWHKSMSGTPSLPSTGEWVECNGQQINDSQSPYNTQFAPNLNNPDTLGYFLRGSNTSGALQTDTFQGHYHNRITNGVTGISGSGPWTFTTGSSAGTVVDVTVTEPISDGTNGTPRTANETRPVNMSVVWIMKVK